jgi:hypothetical protein
VTIHNIKIKFKPVHTVRALRLLHSGIKIDFVENNGWIECEIPRLYDYDILFCDYKK